MKRNIHRIISLLLIVAMLIPMLPSLPAHVHAAEAAPESAPVSTGFEGKKVSILSHSMSTYTGVSNNTNANSTIGSNDVYYTVGKLGVYQKDTWWQQAIDALGMELLVNNSWSGSCVFQPRKGAASVGYGDRAVNLHNDHTGEEPDIIWIYLGCNDFAYYKDTFGKAADVDYATLIHDNSNGTYAYSEPKTTCEAYAIMLHKATTRYPEAEIYCITSTARRDPDYADNYADTGQPTAYSAELHKVAQHFGFPIVDLEGAIPKEADLFDQYIGDKRAHCNPLGMDKITEAILSVMLGTDAEIRHVTSPQGIVAEQAVLLGGSYRTEAELADGYSLAVTMDGKDVTAEVCKDGTITIEEVTGDIHVEAVISRDPRDFRWVFQDDILTSVGTSENNLTKLSGTVTNNILNDGIFQLNTSVLLKHDLPWAIEWKCAEDWRGAMLVSHEESATKGMTYLTRTKGGQLCFGTYTGSQYDNYGIDISYLDSETHSYRLENRIAEDGSNMVWLYLDGVEVGPMNNYFIGSKDQNTTSNWVSGKDFVFSFIGMTGHTLRNCQLEYLSVRECDHTYKNGICTACGAEDIDGLPLEGINVLCLGDSITMGQGLTTDTRWTNVLASKYGWTLTNKSQGGISLSSYYYTSNGKTDISIAKKAEILKTMTTKPDVIIVWGGHNDTSYRASPLGTWQDNTTDSFKGALKYIAELADEYAPDATLFVLTPLWVNENPTTLKVPANTSDNNWMFVDAIYEGAEKYGWIPINMDLCGITPYTKSGLLLDNIHPNEAGTEKIVEYLSTELASYGENSKKDTILFNKSDVSMKTGESTTLKAMQSPRSGTGTMTFTWSSSNLSVATVDANGKITAVAHGNAIITATTDNGVSATVRATVDKDDHTYENGICTGCGENAPSESLSLRYDDRYDITGKTVEIVDAGTPTSYKVGYGVAEGTPDDAVITLDGNKLIATGIGTARVKIDGILYEITVEAAPISLLLLAGQSNMQGIDGDPNQSVICPDGMVYATYADRYKKTVEDVTKFAPSALTGAYASINVTGDTACLEHYPIHMLTESGSGREGMDSGLAYEWVRQTGEKVWVINLGYGGSSINGWLEGGEHYLACQELLSACQQTLRQEIAAGHYTLSHMGYFWCQGCADETQTAQWYAEKFQTMHQLFKTELTFDHDSDPATAEKSMEFGAIIPIRAGHSWMGSYRAGAYTHSTNVPYYQSFLDLRFNGPRVAQYWMGNNPDLPDIWNVCTIQEGWATLPDGTDGVAEYFRSAYENGTVDYPVQVQQTTSWYTPTTPADVHDNIHYNQIGYNEIGRESARNALILLGETEAPNVETTVEFMTWDGFTPADSITASTAGHSGTLVVPMVYPVWRSKEVTYSVSNGLRYDYYDLLTDNVFTSGTLTANGAVGTVSVTPKSLTNYHWIFKDSALVPSTENGQTSNPLTLLSGTITDGQFKSVRYQTAESILLLHDETWALEIQISDWTATTGSMLLSGGTNSADGQPYLYFRPADYFVGFGYYDGTQYRNHGVSLKAYGISCGTGTHTYRFVNHIAEDGTNMVWLYVDDTQIAPLTDLYLNSTLAQSENTWISGQDFVLPFLGASNIPITGMKIDSIWVLETGYDSDIHIHTWSDWQTVTAPSIDGPGIDQRTCTGCSETQTREVIGVWQTHDLATYLTPLPDHLCGGLDLWDILPHNTYYYHSGTHWGIHESGSVYSVTISVTEGDRIWATSFGKYGENGNNIGTGAHGIRVTFFDIHGVCKTLTPQQTYAEFSANGYLTVPEGAIAMNIPMYSDSNDNALYILNLPHTYKSTYTEPTCTEAGYVTHICTTCGGTYTDGYEPALGHDYVGITCTVCGGEHPNAADYSGKVISILGDSISTFAGYIPVADGFNLTHLARYPQDNLLTDVNETWWMQTIAELDGKLGINDSWRGSTVSGYPSVTTGVAGYLAAMSNLTQIQNLGSNGTPDVILFYGGTNDLAHTPSLGTFDPATAPTEVDLTTLKWNNLADAYAQTLLRLKHFYPNTQIICLLPTYTTSYYSNDKLAQGNALMASICQHYGVTYIDLRDCGISTADLPDGIHPDATGMDYITNAVLETLLARDVESGENIVHSVTYDLTGVTSSLGYYKGVSDGKAFVTTLTGDDMTVSVTMGGADITARVYADGVITIPAVTGDLVITAAGRVKPIYEDHLQQLPDPYYGVDLWKVLEHDDEYFYIDAWTVHSSGNVYSVTFPVTPGDKIVASSFGAAGSNGATMNGIRITWFDADGVLHSMGPAEVYGEFEENGYLTVPEGAVAVNIPMWTNSNAWELCVYDSSYEPTFSLGTHLQQLPEDVCAGTNLWNVLQPENTYYTGSAWGNLTTNQVWSVTIAVAAGDQIWATSFQKYGSNGNNFNTTNGIRITWFGANGVLKSVSPAETYQEFAANGYITAPEGAVAVNIPMWSGSDSNELYVLGFAHVPGDPVVENQGAHGSHDVVTYCSICGEELSREHDEGYLPGDINGDGLVNNKDVTRLFQYLSDYDVEVVTEALDVNGDGSVNNKDLTRLFQYLSDYEVELH